MRASVSLIALMLATPALAEDVFAQAPVASAVIYPDGATLTLRAEVELPAGTHRVMVPYPGADGLASLPRIQTSEGVEIGALGFRRAVAADPEALYTEAQANAAAAIDAVEDRLEDQKNALEAARADVTALEARVAYLAAVAPPEGGTPAEILATADLVANQTAESLRALTAARTALKPMQDEIQALTGELAAAQAELDRLSPPAAENDMLTVEVTHEAAGPVALEFTEQTWNAGWRVDYDMDLDRDSGTIALDRKIIVTQDTDRAWTDVRMTLSTARPSDAIAPSEVWPDKADIFDPVVARSGAERDRADDTAYLAEPAPMVEAEESAMKTAGLRVDGLAISYVYPDPVSVAPGESAELALDQLTLDAETTIEAAPRYDDTAFLVADITNTTGEPILPGRASLSRDGYFVGQTQIAMIPAGADETLPFGPIEGIRLDTIFKRNEEGDTGLISRSSTRQQQITFTVENLTDEAQDVRALFPLTFSEKEDLEVDVVATPAPDETDVEDRRGVSAWNLTLAPGETQEVQITVELDWPEGELLDWRP